MGGLCQRGFLLRAPDHGIDKPRTNPQDAARRALGARPNPQLGKLPRMSRKGLQKVGSEDGLDRLTEARGLDPSQGPGRLPIALGAWSPGLSDGLEPPVTSRKVTG